MNADEPITAEYLRKRSIDKLYTTIVEGVLRRADQYGVNYVIYVDIHLQEIILDRIKNKFPDCKISFEHATENPGMMRFDPVSSKLAYPPVQCKIIIDWSAPAN